MQREVIEGVVLRDLAGYVGPPDAVVGIHGHGETSVGFNDPLLGRHVLFIGGIGTGKTVAMQKLVESTRAAAGADDVFVFFDTKGDFHAQFYREGDATVAVDGAATFPGARGWNLFEELRSVPDGELLDEVNEIAATLFEAVGESAGDNNKFWSNAAQDVFAGVVTALARLERETGKRFDNSDIRAVADRWDHPVFHKVLGEYADLRGAAQYIEKEGSATTNSVLIFLQQMIRQTFVAAFKESGEFSVREFVRRKGGAALFLEYDVARGTTLTPIFRTLIDLVLKESLGRDRAAGRVFVVLDEFALLPKLRYIDGGLNFGRSLGLRFIVGTQNTGQITDAYGDGLGGSILSAFGTVFAFRLFDAASRAYVQERFGANKTIVRFQSSVRDKGLNEQLADGHVIEDWDITGLKVGECLAGLPECDPVRFKVLA